MTHFFCLFSYAAAAAATEYTSRVNLCMIVDFIICEVKECRSRKRENCNFVLAVVLLAAAERNRKEWIRIFELYISQAKHFSRGTNMVRHSAKWCNNARGDFGSALSRKLSALVLTEERKASIVEHNNYERSFLSSFLSTVAGFARISLAWAGKDFLFVGTSSKSRIRHQG